MFKCLFTFGGGNLPGQRSSLTGAGKVTDVHIVEHFLVLGMGVTIPRLLHFEAETGTDLFLMAGKLIRFSISDPIY